MGDAAAVKAGEVVGDYISSNAIPVAMASFIGNIASAVFKRRKRKEED